MKQLELNLNKRLLIVEPPELGFTEEKVIIALGDAERYIGDLTNVERELKFICKGSDLTEDIAEDISDYTNLFNKKCFADYKCDRYSLSTSALESFISAVNASGHHWGENPVKFYDDEADFEKRHKNRTDWEREESRTFNPEKCIIFEIV